MDRRSSRFGKHTFNSLFECSLPTAFRIPAELERAKLPDILQTDGIAHAGGLFELTGRVNDRRPGDSVLWQGIARRSRENFRS